MYPGVLCGIMYQRRKPRMTTTEADAEGGAQQ
jgi:hypothetical protein